MTESTLVPDAGGVCAAFRNIADAGAASATAPALNFGAVVSSFCEGVRKGR